MPKINKVKTFKNVIEYENWILNNRNAELTKIISTVELQGQLIVTYEDFESKYSR
ncbi:hypothetical protein ABFV99_13275 [Cytobacillus horneckiae]|uniref:hypothetical protein n=1 Tax=Cytobacillus horneckiae TaxID=549687 RepID=UPI0034CEC380